MWLKPLDIWLVKKHKLSGLRSLMNSKSLKRHEMIDLFLSLLKHWLFLPPSLARHCVCIQGRVMLILRLVLICRFLFCFILVGKLDNLIL